ncbi:MAG: hypothetical protein ACJAT1_000754 [Marivirga sp.]|jgi:hypothetical protein
MPKNVLKTSLETNFHLLGIVSNNVDYKLAWQLNEAIKINLKRVEDHSIQFRNNSYLKTSKFECSTEYRLYTLLKNKLDDADGFVFLLPEIKNVDYLFLIDDDTENLEILNVKSTLSKINNVILVHQIDIAQLKSIENLFND